MKKREFIKTSTIGIAAVASLKLGSGKLIANGVANQIAPTLNFNYESGNFQKVFSRGTFKTNLSVYRNAAQLLNRQTLHTNQTPKRARFIITHPNKFSAEVVQQASILHNQKIFLKQFSGSPNSLHSESAIKNDLKNTFGSIENLQNKFISVSERLDEQVFVWLVLDIKNQFQIVSAEQGKSALSDELISGNSGFPVLGINLCSYSTTDYNTRSEYIQALFRNMDWSFVNQRYNRAKKFNRV